MRVKIYLAAGVFIALTALKILFGDAAAEINGRVRRMIEMDADYPAAAETIGRELAGKGIAGEIKKVLQFETGQTETAEFTYSNIPADVTVKPAQKSPEITVLNLELNASRKKEEEQEQRQEQEQPAAVTAFLDAQAGYSGYEIPANVITDMPQLPFGFICPVEGIDSSGFGYRLHPIQNEIKFHFGTDFAADCGNNVNAFADGTVRTACYSDSYGNYVVIDHGGGFSSLYAHLSSFCVSEGDTVSMGQNIARVGQTGNATGPHLHFELRLDDEYLNPEYYI